MEFGTAGAEVHYQAQGLRHKISGNSGCECGDENDLKEYPAIAKRIAQVKELIPDAIVYHASLGLALKVYHDDHQLYRDYLDQAIKVLKVDVLMYNLYPFNHNSTDEDFYINATIVREKALEAGIPYWTWLQGFGWLNQGSLAQEPSESELRLQAFVSLAYGYSGFAYWTYAGTYKPYTNAILNADGKLSPIGIALKGAIKEIKNVGEVTKNLTSTGIFFCPSHTYHNEKWISHLPSGTIEWKPQKGYPIGQIKVTDGQKGFVIGLFCDDESRKYFMIVNANHGAGKNAAQTAGAVTVKFDDSVKRIEVLNRQSGQFEIIYLKRNVLNQYVLPGGTGDLFRFVE